MAFNRYICYSLRTRVFIGFMVVCFLSIIGSTAMSYLIIKKSVEDQSKIEMQNKFEALMKTLDYALSHTTVTGSSLPEVLQDEIYQIADINKHDVIIYDLDGNYLVSNKEKGLVDQKRIPQNIL